MPRLHASTPQPLPFAPSLLIRAYLLERAGGNLLVYGSGGLADDADAVEGHGGVARRYLNHQHEASFACAAPAFGAPLHVHEDDAVAAGRACAVDATFAGRHLVGDDLEVVPIPGHTPGATAFLWETDGERLLFTGDSVYIDDGDWVAAVLGSSARERYIESLTLLAGIEFDVLVPWAASAGESPISRQEPAEGRRRLGAIIDRLRRGEDR